MITRIEKFGASWCGPCRALEKTLDQLSDISIIKYDVDECEDLTEEKRIMNVPVLIFYNGDTEVERLVGNVSLATIKAVLEKWKNI